MINVRKIILEEQRAAAGVPFAWGTADCLSFAAAVATRMLGRDPISDLRGRYDSEQSAKRVMVEEGWETWRDIPAAFFVSIPLAQARMGDWVIVADIDGSEAIGVVAGGGLVAVKGHRGIVPLPMSNASEAFRVE